MTYQPVGVGANHLLLQAATPVVDWLTGQLAEGMAVVLANAESRVLGRRAGGTSISRRLDELNCNPGFSFAEEHVGTNALGCVKESPAPVTVLGSEHYREVFSDMTGMAVALRHPIHRWMVGALSVTCRVEDTNELMMPILLSAAREIQSRMYAAVSMRERELLEEFLKVSKRTSAAVVALNQDFIITNTAASTILNPADHTVLWQWAADAVPRDGEYSGEVHLSDGELVRARVRAVGGAGGGSSAGVLVELRQAGAEERTRTVPGASFRDGVPLPGRSAAWKRALEELEAAERSEADVLVTGEAGVGKFRAAFQICRGNPSVVDAALASVEANWFERLHTALSGKAPVVLRHVDRIPAALTGPVAALLEAPKPARIIGTCTDVSGTRLADFFDARVELPPLRNRLEDIADIAPALLRGTRGRSAPRLQTPALQALMAQQWPGNVRELGSVLKSARVRAMGSDIALTHLPSEYRAAPTTRTLLGLKKTERDAILDALAEAASNKHLAAERLGIARSTLYRKMRALGIDPKRRG
ncbi:helix-turn-helix domain-containing protein [Sphaerisporangium sp. NPDC051017]|uniref:sigma-54-dependent Fis family transcriptional regulator n=1 Tax=Sphaerisporangium sp. NPDC051017 TaxID=3154636 RepID=UPI00344AD599